MVHTESCTCKVFSKSKCIAEVSELSTLTCEIAIVHVGMHCIALLCVCGASWLHFESGKGKKIYEKVLNFAFCIQRCVRIL